MRAEHCLNHYRLLDRKQFQDWLAKTGVTKRSDEPSPAFDAQNLPGDLPAIMELLEGRRGYVVAQDKLPGTQTNKRRKELLRQASIDNPDFPEILKVTNMGLARDVEKFDLTPSTLTMLHMGWRNLGSLVPMTRYAHYLHGASDESEVATAADTLAKLNNKYLVGSQVMAHHILIEGQKYGRITTKRLIKREQSGKKFDPNSNDPEHLDHTFQDWLVEKEILERSMKKPESLAWKSTLRRNGYVCGPERLAVMMLAENAGYLVDKNELAYHSLGLPLPENVQHWKDHLGSNLEDKIKPEIGITTIERVGIGFGIKDLKVAPLPLKALAYLWESYGMPINIETLSESIYGDKSDRSVRQTQHAVYDLSNDLKDTQAAVGWAYNYGADKKRQTSPILVSRSSIITPE